MPKNIAIKSYEFITITSFNLWTLAPDKEYNCNKITGTGFILMLEYYIIGQKNKHQTIMDKIMFILNIR